MNAYVPQACLVPEESVGFIVIRFTDVYMCAMCVPGAHRSQKRMSDLLKLELLMNVSDHVDAGNQTQIFCKNI